VGAVISERSHITRYQDRRFNPHADAWVYRNLNRADGPWYSIMQSNRVVGHARFVCLGGGVRFVVKDAGRQRALREGVKNVHAFVVGRVRYTTMFFREGERLQFAYRAGYALEGGRFWVDYKSNLLDPDAYAVRFGLESARTALLSKDGLSVSEPSIFPPE
jgi:hypothetical protein